MKMKRLATVAALVAALALTLCGMKGTPQATTFDTSAIEAWCAGANEGTVRMIGASRYDEQSVIDEQGNVWGIDVPINGNDFLLLWIADNNTVNDVTDDLIIKVWVEAHQ